MIPVYKMITVLWHYTEIYKYNFTAELDAEQKVIPKYIDDEILSLLSENKLNSEKKQMPKQF